MARKLYKVTGTFLVQATNGQRTMVYEHTPVEPARALDGLWDSPSERFEVRISDIEAGDQTVWVRAADAVGNTATTVTHVTVRP